MNRVKIIQELEEISKQYKNSPPNPSKEIAIEMALEIASHIVNDRLKDAQIVIESLGFRLKHRSW